MNNLNALAEKMEKMTLGPVSAHGKPKHHLSKISPPKASKKTVAVVSKPVVRKERNYTLKNRSPQKRGKSIKSLASRRQEKYRERRRETAKRTRKEKRQKELEKLRKNGAEMIEGRTRAQAKIAKTQMKLDE